MISQISVMNELITQRLFPQCLTDEMLEELLHRISSEQFKNDIMNQLIHQHIPQEFTIRATLSQPNNPRPSIYVIFYKNNIRVFHISIHLCLQKPTTQSNRSKGALHIIQNKNRTRSQKIRVNHKNQNSLQFSVGTAVEVGKNIDQNYKDLAQTALDVLTLYFTREPNNQLHLSHTTSNQPHPLFQQYKQSRNTLLASFPKTRKTRKLRR